MENPEKVGYVDMEVTVYVCVCLRAYL